MDNTNVTNRLFWVRILIYDGKYPNSKIKKCLKWDLPWHVRQKWNWYFRYRAALAQVENPKNLVVFTWGNKEPDLRTRMDFVKQSITTKKRMITKISNELQKHKNWLLENHLFGLDGDDGRIIKAEKKINDYTVALNQLMVELGDLKV